MASLTICDECGRPLGDSPCAVAEPVVVRSRGGSGIRVRLVVEEAEGGVGQNLHPACARKIVEAGDLLEAPEPISLNNRKRRAS